MKSYNNVLILGVMQLWVWSAPAIAIGDSQTGTADRQIIDIPVEFIWTNGKPLPPPMRPAHLYLGLGLAPGKIHSEHAVPWFENVFLGHNTSVSLDLDRLARTVARRVVQETVPPEMEVIPRETRIGRVFPGPNFNSSQSVEFRIGLYDADTRDALLLVYFDRPCHLSGLDRHQEYTLIDSPPRVDVQVDAPGWAWIAVHKTGESTYTEVRAPAPHPVLLITPNSRDLYLKYQEGTS
jgi:hypothetical protein